MQNIRKMKILDSWCVALWQLTSVSISATVITTYYLLGIDSGTMIEASTLIYLLGMVTTPLNAISWYVAGYRTAKRAIEELEERVVGNEEVEK